MLKGMIVHHRIDEATHMLVLGTNVIVRGKDEKQKEVYMIKCRYKDAHGQFHVHEFHPFEIRETYIDPELLKE